MSKFQKSGVVLKKELKKMNINNKEDLWKTAVQFIKFGIVGVSNTAVLLAIYYVFIYFNENLYIVGNTVGFIVSVLNSYYWNNKYVFEKKNRGNLKPLIKVFASYAATFLLGTGMLFIMVKVLSVSKVIAPIINLLITIPLNFLLNKFWAFK